MVILRDSGDLFTHIIPRYMMALGQSYGYDDVTLNVMGKTDTYQTLTNHDKHEPCAIFGVYCKWIDTHCINMI